jgi:hypothetical protein
MNAPNKSETTALATVQPPTFDLSPRNFEEAWRQAEIMADSDMVPKDFKGKPGNCLIADAVGRRAGPQAHAGRAEPGHHQRSARPVGRRGARAGARLARCAST